MLEVPVVHDQCERHSDWGYEDEEQVHLLIVREIYLGLLLIRIQNVALDQGTREVPEIVRNLYETIGGTEILLTHHVVDHRIETKRNEIIRDAD